MTLPVEPRGLLPENLVDFGRVLRKLGLGAGPDAMLLSTQVVSQVGLARRDDLYWALHSVYVKRAEHRPLFEMAFDRFFRDPQSINKALSLLLPRERAREEKQAEPPSGARRLQEAFRRPPPPDLAREPETEVQFDAAMTFSDQEVLRTKDFEQMSSRELAAVQDAIRRMTLFSRQVQTRRHRPSTRGRRLDLRRTLQVSLRRGGHGIDLVRSVPRTRPPALVVLCDISGSMDRYSRMFLHLVHALTNHRRRVHTFLFGTRLTPVTRWLTTKDVDEALDRVGREVNDWAGGTRIEACLHDFNRNWSRRVLAQPAWVLLITDGLERGEPERLAFEADRLHRSCRRLIWLNPLLRWEGFEPKAKGIRSLIDHVDDFRPVHNLASLQQLVRVLSEEGVR